MSPESKLDPLKKWCYFCGTQATNLEHIPPKSFFPKGKRNNLITVPSCETHNQEKSKEDEYIRSLLLRSIQVDGLDHVETLRETQTRAEERAIERALNSDLSKEQIDKSIELLKKYKDDPLGVPKALNEISNNKILPLGLVGLLNKNVQEEVVTDKAGTTIKTTSFQFDQMRFNAFFEHMARGLFFHELGTRWKGPVQILPHTFLKPDASERERLLSKRYRNHFDESKSKGEQKEYFHYEAANMINPETHKLESILINFCIYQTYYFTAVFPETK